MRPPFHPAAEDVTLEGLLYALSDPARVQIFAEITYSEFPLICSSFLKLNNRTLAKSTLSQHFKILRESGLIHSEPKGVEMRNTSRAGELKQRYGDVISSILAAYCARDLKAKARKR